MNKAKRDCMPITPKEAAVMAAMHEDEAQLSELGTVSQNIYLAAKHGKYSCKINEILSAQTVDILASMGYLVNKNYSSDTTTIYWDYTDIDNED